MNLLLWAPLFIVKYARSNFNSVVKKLGMMVVYQQSIFLMTPFIVQPAVVLSKQIYHITHNSDPFILNVFFL